MIHEPLQPEPELRPLHAVWLWTRPYAEVYRLQCELLEHVKTAPYDLVLLLEHEPCITLGRGAHAENLLATRQFLDERGVTVHNTDRGGDITLHAPGQLIAYPIVNLNHGKKDVRHYVRMLTRTMSELLGPEGVGSGELPGKIGLWVDQTSIATWPGAERAAAPAKIAAIGVRISRWVTMHGFALNLCTDLSLFQWIVPCGIGELPVTSLLTLTGIQLSPHAVAQRAHEHLAVALGRPLGGFVQFAGILSRAEMLAALGVD
jgi:lipoyl(octanoyl) transferase